jgi:hypothetical protein
VIAPKFTAISSTTLINPIPDDYEKFYTAGVEAYCLAASPDPKDMARGKLAKLDWLKALEDIRRQGDRETNTYGLLPATTPVENVYAYQRNPQDPGQPY